MTNWQTKKLGEVCDIGAGNSAPQKREYFIDGIYPFFRTSDIGQVHIGRITKSSDYLNDKGIKGLKLFNKGTILLPKSGASTFLNHRVVLGIDGYVSSHLATIKTDEKVLNNNYLFYFLQEVKAQDLIQDHKYPSLNLPVIGNIEISYPESIPEQHRIVKILDEVFEKTTKAKENAEKNLNNSKELFESYLQSVFTDDAEQKKLGDKSLFQIIDGDRGKNYPKKSDFHNEGYCLFLNTKNVRPNGFDFKTTMFITEKKDNVLGNGKLKRNDVLLTTRGTIGNIAVYNGNVLFENIRINSGMLIFRPNTKLIIPEYLFAIFQSGIMKTQIKKYVSGAAQPQLPIKTLVNFSIPVPKSISEQKSIVAKLDKLSAETKKLEAIYKQKLVDLEELKKSVLKKAFAGEL